MGESNPINPHFTGPLQFQDNGGFPFVLLKALSYVTAVVPRYPTTRVLGRIITVPAGFKTDLASIPRVLWNVLPPVGSYDAAAVVHDYLYQHNGVTRRQADDILHEAMGVLGVSSAVREAIYLGVRLGGWVTWRRYRSKEQV
jgi:hypothetical protein